MRVPDDFTGLDNLDIGVEFKSSVLGNFTSTEKIKNLKFSKPSLESFFQDLGPGSMENNAEAFLKACEKAAEYYNDNPNFLNNYAWMLVTAKNQKLRNPEKAIILAKRAVKLTQGQAGYILDTLAVAYHDNGQLEKAVETIEKAVHLSGSCKEISDRAEKYRKELKKKGFK